MRYYGDENSGMRPDTGKPPHVVERFKAMADAGLTRQVEPGGGKGGSLGSGRWTHKAVTRAQTRTMRMAPANAHKPFHGGYPEIASTERAGIELRELLNPTPAKARLHQQDRNTLNEAVWLLDDMSSYTSGELYDNVQEAVGALRWILQERG